MFLSSMVELFSRFTAFSLDGAIFQLFENRGWIKISLPLLFVW
jgi:hypothetical protein